MDMLRASKDIASCFDTKKDAVVYLGDCLDLLRQIPNRALQLVVTSPPYNIGKEYEKRLNIAS
jgi:adenine-specific DNA-methyltransferase